MLCEKSLYIVQSEGSLHKPQPQYFAWADLERTARRGSRRLKANVLRRCGSVNLSSILHVAD